LLLFSDVLLFLTLDRVLLPLLLLLLGDVVRRVEHLLLLSDLLLLLSDLLLLLSDLLLLLSDLLLLLSDLLLLLSDLLLLPLVLPTMMCSYCET
jgi:hypothetical protein